MVTYATQRKLIERFHTYLHGWTIALMTQYALLETSGTKCSNLRYDVAVQTELSHMPKEERQTQNDKNFTVCTHYTQTDGANFD